MKSDDESVLADQSLKPRRSKSREVSSRFLSPSSITTPLLDAGAPSPSQASSPLRRKSTSIDTPKHRRFVDSGFIRGLWPSSSSSSTTSPSPSNTKLDTLADHLGNERLNDLLERKTHEKKSKNTGPFSLSRQRSCTEINRFEKEKESTKENHRPSFGGSMRYTGKLGFSKKLSSSTTSSSSSANPNSAQNSHSSILPGRLSVDENVLYGKSSQPKPADSFTDYSESESSELCSSTDYDSLAKIVSLSSRKSSGIEVSSRYLQPTRTRRGTSDSNIPSPVSADYSPRMKKFPLKNVIKRANSLTGYGSATSQWALSPGRSGSPTMSVENKARPMSFSSLKPPGSPSRAKGVEKLLHLGLDLFKSKKSSTYQVGSGSSDMETVHQLRLLHNRWMQWRYANARSNAVNDTKDNQVQTNLLNAWSTLTKLRHSVLYKNLQLLKEKLEMKMGFILHSQLKPLEAWADMERQHLSAISMTKESLHSVICRVPLTEGAKVDPHSASITLWQALDLTASVKLALSTFSQRAEKTMALLSQLAKVAAQEKLLLQECLELLRTIFILEIEERSLRSHILQLSLLQSQLQIGNK